MRTPQPVLLNGGDLICPVFAEPAPLAVIRQVQAGGTQMLVKVAGELDLVTAPRLAESLELARQEVGGLSRVVEIAVDLRAVEFLGTAGIRELVCAWARCRAAAVPLYVVAGQRAVTRPLVLAGLAADLGLRVVPGAPGRGGAWQSRYSMRVCRPLSDPDRLRLSVWLAS